MSSPALRFQFGENWWRFLETVDEARIERAERALIELLGQDRLDGLTFLDIGSGSGLSSLAARRLGATVTSFDYDRQSVVSTRALRERHYPDDEAWRIEEGSILDHEFLRTLPTFDIVYAWGLASHRPHVGVARKRRGTGPSRGQTRDRHLQRSGKATRVWTRVKRSYNALPGRLRWLVLGPAAAWIWGPAMIRDVAVLRPFATWREYHHVRGMSPWRDLVDWVGGYPFETAKPEQVFEYYRRKRFRLVRLTTCGGGFGCNEFVFINERASTE